MIALTRLSVAGVAVVMALTLSACGDAVDPQTGGTVGFTEEISEDDEGNLVVTFTVGEKDYRFTQRDGEWTEEQWSRLHAIVVGMHGFYTSQLGHHTVTERWSNHSFMECDPIDNSRGEDCRYLTFFGGWGDELYPIDLPDEDRCTLRFEFEEGDFSLDLDYWVISTVEVPGPELNTWEITREERYGASPTREHLESFGRDGLPCAGVAVP